MYRVLALSGGVGGAKLSQGLAQLLSDIELDVLVNTADDFEHLGLHISPDIDSLLYTLAGLNDDKRGWGLADESWVTLERLKSIGGESWFQLGDRDLATHLWRTAELRDGQSLSLLTAKLASRLGINAQVHPMTDQRVSTIVHSDQGDLTFQHYFVRHACEPKVSGFTFDGIDAAHLNPEVARRIGEGVYDSIVLCPSNPFVSLAPVLQLENCWQLLRDAVAPVAAVSPIVGGQAIKGPAAKMMAELALPVSALGVARHYQERYPNLVDLWVLDEADQELAADIEQLGCRTLVMPTVMKSAADRHNLAFKILVELGHDLAS